jgi:hypothetical protein
MTCSIINYYVYVCISMIFYFFILRNIVACVVLLLCFKMIDSMHNSASRVSYSLSRELPVSIFFTCKINLFYKEG